MLKVAIFGTGINMQKIIRFINYAEVKIILYLDNDSNKIGRKLNNIEIINPNKINKYEYDFIVIASTDYEEITNQLIKLKVDFNKIVQFYNYIPILPDIFFYNNDKMENIDLAKLFVNNYCARMYGW